MQLLEPELSETQATNAAETISTSKQQILDAAQCILATQGYAGLSMRELAVESGLAKATIYHHFHDKSEIFRQVLERDMATVHTQLQAAADSVTGAEAKLQAIIRTYFQLMRERRTIIITVLRELGQQESNLCEFINAHRDRYFTPIRSTLEAGIAEGIFRPLNVEHAAISMIGMINAFMIFGVLADQAEPDQAEPDEAIVDQTIALFLQGVEQRR